MEIGNKIALWGVFVSAAGVVITTILTIVIILLTFITTKATKASAESAEASATASIKSYELSKEMLRIQEEKEKNNKRDIEEARVSMAVENFTDAVLRNHSDIPNEGKRYHELKEMAAKGSMFRNFVDYREDFKKPISEQIDSDLQNKYNLIRIYHKEQIFKEQNGAEYVFANQYIELFENIGVEKKLRLFITDEVNKRRGDLG